MNKKTIKTTQPYLKIYKPGDIVYLDTGGPAIKAQILKAVITGTAATDVRYEAVWWINAARNVGHIAPFEIIHTKPPEATIGFN